ncbi:MAG: hypothetical protein FWG65_09980 [Turicibacter sp.]|nr:hypothetical protein [Turicibacter sp.]
MTVNNIATNQMSQTMIQMSTGQRINSAADDAAGLAISERMTAQIRGNEQGTRNVADMQSLVNTAEGGLSTISESLLRIRDLNMQASNGILTDSDRQNIQMEVDQLVSEIDAIASRTQFNGMNLLDGSFSAQDGRGLHVAADASGLGPTVNIGNMSSSMILGPDPINVTDGSFDMQRIDEALSRVSNERSYLGAMSNRFDTTIANNQITNLNMAAARSNIADQDMAAGATQLAQQSIMEQVQMMMERQQQEQSGVQVASIIG